tara:strand:- start:945 stop:1550 length:606 start_codon:yes stop_codon:yes gene_type:complete
MDWNDLNGHEKTGYVGSLMLIVGPFMPVACVPLFGCFNYIDGDGIFILALGLISTYLVKVERFKSLAISGGLSLLIILSFWADISGEDLISAGSGLWVILAGSIIVCYTSWNAWGANIDGGKTYENKPLPNVIPLVTAATIKTNETHSNSSPSKPPKFVAKKESIITIECPECAAKMSVTKLGKMQNVTCDSCGTSGEINI